MGGHRGADGWLCLTEGDVGVGEGVQQGKGSAGVGDCEGMRASRMSHLSPTRKQGPKERERERDSTGLFEVDDVLDAFDSVFEDLSVLLLAHGFVLGGDGKEHQDGFDGLLDKLEEVGVESPDVGEAVAVRGRGVESERGGPAVERVRVAVMWSAQRS